MSIAAGFSPLGVGTETSGSVVYPASVSGLYGLKPTYGSIPSEGVFKLSVTYDTIGAMARDPEDLANLIDILSSPKQPISRIFKDDSWDTLSTWKSLAIGIVDINWGLGPDSIKGKWDLPDVVCPISNNC